MTKKPYCVLPETETDRDRDRDRDRNRDRDRDRDKYMFADFEGNDNPLNWVVYFILFACFYNIERAIDIIHCYKRVLRNSTFASLGSRTVPFLYSRPVGKEIGSIIIIFIIIIIIIIIIIMAYIVAFLQGGFSCGGVRVIMHRMVS